MKLQIGEKLKELRHQNDITQDRLAEVLGVSSQSVSRWELGICYPDLELLPSIANYFDITLDDLVGMNKIRSEEARIAIFTEVLNLERGKQWDKAVEALRNALKTFPEDDEMETELALVLPKTGKQKDLMEAITLSEKVLDRCTGEKLRSTARANLCFLYKAAGLTEKAAAMGKTLPQIWECREVLIPDLVPEEIRDEMVERGFNIAYQVLCDVAAGNEISFSLGYRPEDTVKNGRLIQFIQQGAK